MENLNIAVIKSYNGGTECVWEKVFCERARFKL